MEFPSRSHDKRKGSVLPLVALSITVLLAATSLAVDYGVLLADKNQLQRTCDASALAGAGYLQRTGNATTDTTNATNQALLVAQENNLAPSEMVASNITFLDNNTKIHVVGTRARSLFFARIFGMTEGNVRAAATAVANPTAGPPVPIAITNVSKARYQGDGESHTFTLFRPQESAFATNYSGISAFDPFTVFDLRGGQSKSGTFMTRQLEGDLTNPVNPQIGDTLTGLALSLGTLSDDFKAGISPRFVRAAAPPWLDPPVSLPLSSAWQLLALATAMF